MSIESAVLFLFAWNGAFFARPRLTTRRCSSSPGTSVLPRPSSSAISSKFLVVIAPMSGTWWPSSRTSSIEVARSAPPYSLNSLRSYRSSRKRSATLAVMAPAIRALLREYSSTTSWGTNSSRRF